MSNPNLSPTSVVSTPRAGVWPDSVQVIGGQLSMRLPTS